MSLKSFIAGGGGGASLVLVGQPFDTIKVRLQNERTKVARFSGLGDCLRQTLRHAGVRTSAKYIKAKSKTSELL